MTRLFSNKKILFSFTIFVFILFFSKTVFAVWSNTFYEPGDTLNPECLPTDPRCDVRSPLTAINISDTAFDSSWDTDVTHAPSKNAVYDQMQILVASSHNPVTLGTANGLSLSTQALSLGLASTSTTGALSSTDWNTFNGLITSKADVGQTFYVGTTQVPINRTSGTLSLAGVNIDGNAGTVTNGVYTNIANSFSLLNPLTTLAESWIGPSSVAGIYFKDGNVGIGTTTPSSKLDVNGVANVATGFTVGGVAATSGKILKSNGTNFVSSTETYATPGTSGNLMTSDGTNWTSTNTIASTVLGNSSIYIGTTSHTLNRTSAAEKLSGITGLTPGADFTLTQNSVDAMTSVESGAVANTLYLKAGKVGIDTTTPTSLLSVGSTSQFQVDSSGNIVSLNGVATSFPSVNASGVLTNNGSGTLTWSAAGSGSSSLSGLTASTATNTIDNLNFAQTWNWSTANTQNPLTMNFNALTTGSAFSLLTSNASLASTNGFLYVANTGAATGATPFVRLQPNSTSGSGITLTNAGNVGIGTAAPVSKLAIITAETSSTREKILNFSLSGLTDTTAVAGFSNGTITDGVMAPLYYSFRNDATNKFVLGNAGIIGSSGDVAGYEPIILLESSVTNNPSDPTNGTYSAVSNRNILGISSAGSIKMVVGPTGNVGIGTTTPDAPSAQGTALHIYNGQNTGTVASNATIVLNSANRNSNYIGRISSNASSSYLVQGVDAVTNYGQFGVSSNSGSPYAYIGTGGTERMRIDSSGNIGIGNTAPSTKLDVTGTVTATAFAGDGSGLTNLPNSSQWTSSGLNIKYDNGFVSMGVANPLARLHVAPLDNTGFTQGFELNSLGILTTAGNGPWYVTSATAHTGTYSVVNTSRPNGVNGDYHSYLYLPYTITANSTFSFYYKIPASSGAIFSVFDYFAPAAPNEDRYIGGEGGALDANWHYKQFTIAEGGAHTFRFEVSCISNDCPVYVDDIVITPPGGAIVPAALFDGAVGINTAAPTAMLDVNGSVKATSFVGDGSGLTNLPAGSQWTTSGSNVYYNSGNIGIGTTSPSYKLSVSGGSLFLVGTPAIGGSVSMLYGVDGTYPSAEISAVKTSSDNATDLIFDSWTGSTYTEKMRILSSGNVGIGTASPAQRLSLSGASNVNTLTEQYSDDINAGGVLGLKARGTSASPAVPQADDNLIGFGGGGYNGTTMYTYNKAFIGMRAAQTWSGTANGTYITFQTTPNNSTIRAEAMRIDQSGNVGIGTTTPDAPSAQGTALHIYNGQNTGTVASNATIVLNSANRNSNYIGRISSNASSSYLVQGVDAVTNYGQFGVSSNNSSPFAYIGTGGVERMRIDSNGFMGLGTIAPTANFQVAQSTIGIGTVSVSGTAVTGVGTQFTSTFRVGDNITVTTSNGAETKAITTITSDTVLVTAAFSGTAAAGTAYTLVGGNRFSILGNGTVNLFSNVVNQIVYSDGTLRPVYIGMRYKGTASAPLTVANGDQIFSFIGSGYDGTTLINGVAMDFVADNTVSTGVMPIKISFTTGTNGGRTEKMVIRSDGKVGIGAASPTTMLTVGTASTNTGNITVYGTGTTCTIGSGTGATNCTSDIRLKDDVANLGSELNNIMALRPITFKWKDKMKDQIVNTGLIAQEVQLIYPNMVHTVYDDYLGIDYAALVVPSIKAIQELNLNLEGISGTIIPLEGSSNESFVTAFFNNVYEKVRTLLADAGNGITKIFVGEVNTNKLCVKKSDGVDVCVTGDQLDALIRSAGNINTPPSQGSGVVNIPNPTCSDGIQNQNETGIDTGGVCTPVIELPAIETPVCVEPQILENNVCVDPAIEPLVTDPISTPPASITDESI